MVGLSMHRIKFIFNKMIKQMLNPKIKKKFKKKGKRKINPMVCITARLCIKRQRYTGSSDDRV